MITQKIIARTDSLKLDKIISRYGEDSMRQVVFIIVRPDPDSEELIPITIPDDAVGSFRILKPSGNFVIVPMSKSVLASGETAFDVVLPASANTAKGSGYYDIRITSDTDKYYFTAQGDFLIDDNIISDEVLEDVSEVNGLIFPDDFLTIEDHVAYIDDDTITTDSTWSSNKINEEIEAHAGGDVSKTVSGNPVTFEDGAAAPLVKCVTEIQGSQDLHGYDKPWVGGAGKNKCIPRITRNTTVNGITVNVLKNSGDNVIGYAIPQNTATANANIVLGEITPPSDNTYIFSGCAINNPTANCRVFIWDETASASVISSITEDVSASLTANHQYLVALLVNSGDTISASELHPMIRSASESDSTFAPYSNICPITAYTEGEIEVRGKNIADPSVYKQDYVLASNGSENSAPDYCITNRVRIDANTVYTCYLTSKPGGNDTLRLGFYDDDMNFINRPTIRNGSFTTPVNAYWLRLSYNNVNPDLTNIMIVKGSVPYAYEPYTSTTHTTTYPSAIYRGSEDCVNGEVVTDWGMIASYAGETLPGEWISDRDEYAPGTTPTTGAQVAYELDTPTTSSVTSTNLPIKSLSGYTHIESSTGDMEVEYITERFQPLIDSIKQL